MFHAVPPAAIGVLVGADYDRVRWYGDGPEECYVDRREGARLGVYDELAHELDITDPGVAQALTQLPPGVANQPLSASQRRHSSSDP